MSDPARSCTRLLMLLVILLGAGCESGGGQVESGITYDPNSAGGRIVELLATNAKTYEIGAPISVRLTNRTGRGVGYNLCRSRLERLDDDGVWRLMVDGLADACTAELRTLAPGQSVTYTFRSAPSARPGQQYRVSTDLQDLKASLRFIGVSNTFALSGTD